MRLSGGRFTGWNTSYCIKERRCLFIMGEKKASALCANCFAMSDLVFKHLFLFPLSFLTWLTSSPFSSFNFFMDFFSFLFLHSSIF